MGFKTIAQATVSAANTATRITAAESVPATRIAASTVVLQSPTDGSTIWVGDSSVASSPTQRGSCLIAGAFLTLPAIPNSANPYNLADIYFASTASTAKINVTYIEG